MPVRSAQCRCVAYTDKPAYPGPARRSRGRAAESNPGRAAPQAGLKVRSFTAAASVWRSYSAVCRERYALDAALHA